MSIPDIRSDTRSLIHALKVLAQAEERAADVAEEEGDGINHMVRATCLTEASERMNEMLLLLNRFAFFEETLARVSRDEDNQVRLQCFGPCEGDYDTQQVVVAGDKSGWATLTRGDFRKAKELTLDVRPLPLAEGQQAAAQKCQPGSGS